MAFFFSRRKSEGRAFSSANSAVCWCVFNTAYAPFKNLKLRQAFAYAIHRAEIISNAYFELKPAFSAIQANPHDPSFHFPEGDAEKARQLLHEALEELNLCKEDLLPLTLIFLEQGRGQYIADCLQKQFKDHLGLDFELQPLPWKSLFSKFTSGHFQMGLTHWSSWVNDPIYTLNIFKTSNQEINFAKWEDPTYRRLLDLSEQEINLDRRLSYLYEAEEILNREMPIIPLFYQACHALIHSNLHVIGNQFDRINLGRITCLQLHKTSN